MRLTGYAAIFNSLSVDLGGFVETIAPGAFTRTLGDGHPIFAVHHHLMSDVLGSTRSKTLRLGQDDTGLWFELKLPDSSLGRDIHELVQRGDLASMSFSFSVQDTQGESWRETPSGQIERTLHNVHLREISAVALPAYPATKVAARSMPAVNQVNSTVVRQPGQVVPPVTTVPMPTASYAAEAKARMLRRVLSTRLHVA